MNISRHVDDLKWEKITEYILDSIYGKRREIPLNLPGTNFTIKNLNVYGEKPGEEITIDSNEVHVIACTLRSVFTSLMNSFGRSVDEEIKEDEEWYNSGHGLIELSKLLPKGEARKNMFENVFRLLIQEEGANNADDPETR